MQRADLPFLRRRSGNDDDVDGGSSTDKFRQLAVGGESANRRLKEENPEQSRVLTLEAVLEQSKGRN